MVQSKRTRKYFIVLVTTLVLVVIVLSATYAYFYSISSLSHGNTIATMQTKSVDNLVFNTGQDISIVANQTNFAENRGNISQSTTASVVYKARNDTNYSEYYKAMLFIPINEFVYSDGITPELLLTVTKNGVNIITNQDITTTTGMIEIPISSSSLETKQVISANAGATTTDTWVATITFVNLTTNQNVNTGKSFRASLYFDIAPQIPNEYTELNSLALDSVSTGIDIDLGGDYEIDLRFSNDTNLNNKLLYSVGLYFNMEFEYIHCESCFGYSYYVAFDLNKNEIYQYNMKHIPGNYYLSIIGLPTNHKVSNSDLHHVDSFSLATDGMRKDSFTFYNCKIYIDGKLAHNFVPCRRNSDNVEGIYDTKYGVFYVEDSPPSPEEGEWL